MTARAAKIAEAFSANTLKILYAECPIDELVNRDHVGEIGEGSVLNILTIGEQDEQDYNGNNLNPQILTESNAQLIINQKKSMYPIVKDLDNFVSYIKNPKDTVITQILNRRKKNLMKFLLSFWGKVAAGNRIGTDYTTGTVTIDAAGNVTGAGGAAFSSAMVGRGFKATGHSKWYRVKTFTTSTSIAVEIDSDDEVSAYDGGIITAAAYVIEAVTPVTLTAGNIRQYLGKVKIKFDLAEVPDEDRKIFVSTEVEDLITQGTNINLSVPAAYDELVKKGYLLEILGMKIFRQINIAGDNTNGYRNLGVQRNWLTFADKQLRARVEEDLAGNFGAAYKDLYVYGAKVADARRKFAVELFAKV